MSWLIPRKVKADERRQQVRRNRQPRPLGNIVDVGSDLQAQPGAHRLGQQGVIDKAGIDELAVMFVGIVARMIDAGGTAFAAIAVIQGRQAQMLEISGIIRT